MWVLFGNVNAGISNMEKNPLKNAQNVTRLIALQNYPKKLLTKEAEIKLTIMFKFSKFKKYIQ